MIEQERQLKIEEMNNKHIDEVLKIEKLSFPTPWSKDAFIAEINENEFAHYYVILLNKKVIGYAGMWIILDEAHITTIAVNPKFRNKSFGRLLLNMLMKEAVVLGTDRITLEVRPSNYSAKSLYDRIGFKSAGIRKGYYTDTKEDAIIMWKSLRS